MKPEITLSGLAALALLSSACLEPETDDVWQLDTRGSIPTIGYCRDVIVQDSLAYIAAGQAGLQIWKIMAAGTLLEELELLARVDSLSATKQFDDVYRLGVSALNNRVFAIESGSKVYPLTIHSWDSITADLETMSLYTQDFLVLDALEPGIPDSTYLLVAADRDDGLKVQSYRYRPFLGVWGWYEDPGYISGEGQTFGFQDGRPSALAYTPGHFALGVGQIGVALFSVDLVAPAIGFREVYDTPGNALGVAWQPPHLFVAADDGGLVIFELGQDGKLARLAAAGSGLGVEHVTVRGAVAALSLGNNGLALMDISDPGKPVERGIFKIGYIYRSFFAHDYLFVARREGLLIVKIVQ